MIVQVGFSLMALVVSLGGRRWVGDDMWRLGGSLVVLEVTVDSERDGRVRVARKQSDESGFEAQSKSVGSQRRTTV